MARFAERLQVPYFGFSLFMERLEVIDFELV